MEMFKVSWKLSEVFCFVFAERRERKMETHWTLAITYIGMGGGVGRSKGKAVWKILRLGSVGVGAVLNKKVGHPNVYL